MNRTVPCGALTVALAATLAQSPAYAEGEFPIEVSTTAKPGDPITVTGDAATPLCADDGVTVTLYYARPNGTSTSVNATAITDSAGHFSVALAVPADAPADQVAGVSAVIADCSSPDGTHPSQYSESEQFTIVAHTGTLGVDKTSGRPGETVRVSGTSCWGGQVALYFFQTVTGSGVVKADRTFTGSLTLPNVPGGAYGIGAQCPGTAYDAVPFTLVDPVRVAPPATPVPGRPRFTG